MRNRNKSFLIHNIAIVLPLRSGWTGLFADESLAGDDGLLGPDTQGSLGGPVGVGEDPRPEAAATTRHWRLF
jgi:hypothetical protein